MRLKRDYRPDTQFLRVLYLPRELETGLKDANNEHLKVLERDRTRNAFKGGWVNIVKPPSSCLRGLPFPLLELSQQSKIHTLFCTCS